MTVLARLDHWRTTGAITPSQYDAIAAIVRRDRFSVFVELNLLLFIGIVSFLAGVGWTIQTYFQSLGDVAILAALTFLWAFCLYYCFSRSLPYSTGPVESTSFAFDYILYLGTVAFSVEMAYVESRFHLLTDRWDYYLLLSAGLFFFLAYRFDNRLVLALALSTLAGWFGINFSRTGFAASNDSLRASLFGYGLATAGLGTFLHRRGLKRHFYLTYLHIAANVVFLALVSGVKDSPHGPYLAALVLLTAAVIFASLHFSDFSLAGYATVYCYVGISMAVLTDVRSLTAALFYFVISGSLVIWFVSWLAGRIRRTK